MISKQLKKVKHELSDFWRRMSRSSYHHMSRGAEYIARIIPYGRRENWRRHDKKK